MSGLEYNTCRYIHVYDYKYLAWVWGANRKDKVHETPKSALYNEDFVNSLFQQRFTFFLFNKLYSLKKCVFQYLNLSISDNKLV